MKVLSILNEKGGVGKSFIATQFAYFCRYKLGNRVLVIDLDQQGNSGDILSASGLCQPASVFSGKIMKEGVPIEANSTFMVVKGDDSLLELSDVGDDGIVTYNLSKAITDVQDNFDICIIDCPPSADVRQFAALSVATDYLVPFQVKAESIAGVDKTLSRATVIKDSINPDLNFLGLLMSLVRMQGIQKSNYEALLKTMGHILLKRYDPKTKTESGVCCITDRSEFAAAQQMKRPVFYSENGQKRKEALEVARVWITLIHQLGLPIKKPIKIEKDPQTGKLREVPTPIEQFKPTASAEENAQEQVNNA